jgi:nucleotide-binding universal stress UspA family protein
MTGPVVLVALDGSKRALGALPVARRLAELEKASVRLLHVTEGSGPRDDTAEALGLQPADLAGATLEVRAGKSAETILAAAEGCGASLIVMCAHAADVPPADALGAAALAVIRGAACPLVLVDPALASGGWTVRRVLAAHDGSPSVSGALGPAADLAREAGAELVVLQVAAETRPLETGSIAPLAYLDQVQHEWPAWSREFLHRLACHCQLAGIPVRLLVAHGDPAEETIRVAGAEAVDLIVLAWRGYWEGPRASTLKAVLQGAPCPVMVTRVAAA